MKKVIALIGVVTFLALNVSAVSACTCLNIGTPKTDMAKVGAVFLGKVVAAKKGEWTIAVDKVWKGDVEERVLMRARSTGGSCDPQFDLGESYIFFADAEQARRKVIYRPRTCTWTTSLTFRYEGVLVSEHILQELGESRTPAKNSSKERSP